MQNFEISRSVPWPRRHGVLAAPDGAGVASQASQEYLKNIQFVDLLNAFRCSGGLARMPEVAGRFKGRSAKDDFPLTGWLAKRQVISVEWQSKIWLPLFQFNPAGLTLRTGLSAVLAELVLVYDDWQVANWFAQPNPWLANGAPADRLAMAAPQVLNAALAERLVAAA